MVTAVVMFEFLHLDGFGRQAAHPAIWAKAVVPLSNTRDSTRDRSKSVRHRTDLAQEPR
jgi:hypothetical protein